ncbi:MAG: hypothetical protein HY308_16420 [Gammaproteobacteria bacterium]|nr:hypothetical protein [Gammaproteobacteria bacterium]
MNSNALSDLSKELINEAESACAESDPEMRESAGMVLVGDIYAVLASHPEEHLEKIHDVRPPETDTDSLEPFIR